MTSHLKKLHNSRMDREHIPRPTEISQEFKLCYVKEPWAFFTTQEIKNQWGDDWNDTPYEHNAGEPYRANKDRGEEWGITKVAFEGPLYTPDHNCSSSGWSVKEINGRQIAWLRTDKWFKGKPINIFAGETLKMFISKIILAGGKVYFDWEWSPKEA